ncbi:MAG: RsmB/NOP family class I SAM-dependent RNA methyltransferase, partial [Chloroflexia bacterium]
PWCPEAVLLPPDVHLGRHPFHAAGLFYLQEPGATAAIPALDPQPGERLLDLCAAPGGKATHIAARLRGEGLLWANEVNGRRARVLLENLERWGARNIVVSAEHPERLAERLPGFFDRVLVDAPCSGEALFRREPESVREWSPATVRGCARRQGRLLDSAAKLVRPGGVLLYVTCTFSPEENEGGIGAFLETHPEYALEEISPLPGFAPGRPEWVEGLPSEARESLRRTVRLWPHRAPAEGHFLARLRRVGGGPSPKPPSFRGPSPGPAVRQALSAFWQEVLPDLPLPERLALWGERVLALPPELPDVSGLRLLRAGWLLGSIRRGRFLPAHALAMGLYPGQAAGRLDLSPEAPEVVAFLRGETLRSEGPAGWLLVTVAGYPLGWGRRVGAVVKNHRPHGWPV